MPVLPWKKPPMELKKNAPEKEASLRVIGVGLPRTGTVSLNAALEILGFGPCHHMMDLFWTSTRTKEFIRAYDGEKVDFHALMKGYGSTVDAPTVDFYKEIHRAYPKAKLVLTVRDSDEKWYESFQNTVGSKAANNFYRFCVYLFRTLRLQHTTIQKMVVKWKKDYGVVGPSTHAKHNKRVISEHKEGEVLVFNVKEGWAPLCKFLNVDIPEGISFPKANETESFKRNVLHSEILGLFSWTVVGALIGLSIYTIKQTM